MSSKQMTEFRVPENTPQKAPLPGFDPQEANFFDMFSPQYYNLDTVQALMQEGGGPLLRQVDRVAVEYVYNPERGEDSGEWKPVAYFVDGGPSLVINQTRAKVLMQATNSIQVSQWQNVGLLEIATGIENGNAQIVISPVKSAVNGKQGDADDSDGQSVIDAINEELFS